MEKAFVVVIIVQFEDFRFPSCYFMVRSALLMLVFTGLCSFANAQEWPGFGVEANMIGGKVFRHTPKFKAPIPEFSKAVELNFVQQTFGLKEWHQGWNYPLVGLAVAYTDYGIDSVYGNCIALYPNVQLPIITGRHVEWTFRAGMGIGYATRHYQRSPDWDTLNNAIGSHLNNFTHFATDFRYRVNEHVDVQAGINFSHMSNGGFRLPNLGVNMYGAHIGLRYFPGTSQPERIERLNPPLRNRWLAQVRGGLAFNESGYTDGPLYLTYLVSAYASRRYGGKNKMFAGLDYSYHERVAAFLKNNEIFPGEESQHSWKSAVFVGNEFLLGRLGVVMQVGYYLKDAYLHSEPYYEKLGGHYYLIQQEKGPLKELFVAALLKTHLEQAELIEFGVGVGF